MTALKIRDSECLAGESVKLGVTVWSLGASVDEEEGGEPKAEGGPENQMQFMDKF